MMERYLRGIAGIMALAGLTLAYCHSPYWLILTTFTGLNLLQSAFTDWCPMMPILRAFGIKERGRE